MALSYNKNKAYNPTYRDLSKRFKQLREGHRSDYVVTAERSNSKDSGKSLLLNEDKTSHLKINTAPFTTGLPPLWVETLESIDADAETIIQQSYRNIYYIINDG